MTTATLNTQREQLRQQYCDAVDQLSIMRADKSISFETYTQQRERTVEIAQQIAATFTKGERVRALVNMGGGHRAYFESGTFVGCRQSSDELCYTADATPDYVTRCAPQHIWSLDESRV